MYRVLFDTTGAGKRSGGMETVVSGLERGFREATPGAELHIYPGASTKPLRVSRLGWHRLRRTWLQQIDLRQAVRETRVEALLACDPSMPVPRLQIPTTVVVHDLRHLVRPEEFGASQRLYRSVVWSYGIRHADRIVVPSIATRDALARYFPEVSNNVVVIPWGADHVLDWVKAPTGQHAVAFGHWSNKRPDFVVQVWSELRQRDPALALELAVVGLPAKTRQGLQKVIDELGLSDLVQLYPYLPDREFQQVCTGARLLVLPSTLEGFCFPALEAQMLGIPVVASAGVGIEDAGGDVILYAAGDSVHDFADAIQRVFDDPDETQRLCDLGRQHAAQFTWRRSASQLEAVIAETLAARS